MASLKNIIIQTNVENLLSQATYKINCMCEGGKFQILQNYPKGGNASHHGIFCNVFTSSKFYSCTMCITMLQKPSKCIFRNVFLNTIQTGFIIFDSFLSTLTMLQGGVRNQDHLWRRLVFPSWFTVSLERPDFTLIHSATLIWRPLQSYAQTGWSAFIL